MNTILIMFRNVLLFVALALPGYFLVKTKELKPESSGTLSKLLMYVGLPFLIFSGTVEKLTFSPAVVLTMIATAALSVALIVAMFFVSYPLSKMEKDAKKQGMLRFCAVFPNNGFLGIPLAMAVFGPDSPVMTLMIILNIITNILVYTLGVYLVSGDKSSMQLKKAFFNPVLIAFVCGIAVNLAGVSKAIPEISTFSSHFSNIVTPVSMTILGMKMGSVNLKALFCEKKLYYVSFLKLLAFPAAAVAILFIAKIFLPDFITDDLILGFFVALAVPTAGLSSTFADNFDGDTEHAVSYTLGTTILSILTIPCLYWALCLCLGI